MIGTSTIRGEKENTMKFMAAWKIPPRVLQSSSRKISEHSRAPNPTEVKTIGRWQRWHVVEGDAAGVAELEAV
jgi:hypothetical protein